MAFEAVRRLLCCVNGRIVLRLFFPSLARGKAAFEKFLTPIIEERKRQMQFSDFKKPVLAWIVISVLIL
jgi:hypothetical protein